MLFGLGPTELIIILIIVMLLFGVGRLSEIGGALGKSIREFRKSTIDETQEQASVSRDNKEGKTTT